MTPRTKKQIHMGARLWSVPHRMFVRILDIDPRRDLSVMVEFPAETQHWVSWSDLELQDPGVEPEPPEYVVADVPEGVTFKDHTVPSGPYPDNNPKTALGVSKCPLHLVPPIVEAQMAMAWKDGAAKYGPFNWRKEMISSSVYYAAAKRHMAAWYDGEENAEDSGVHHLAHAMACMGMILDGQTCNKLNDDRPPPGGVSKFLAQCVEKPV